MTRIYGIPFARLKETLAALPTPDRAAYKCGVGAWSEYTIQIWPNRQSMARSIRMQQKRAYQSDDWKAVQALTDGEGY